MAKRRRLIVSSDSESYKDDDSDNSHSARGKTVSAKRTAKKLKDIESIQRGSTICARPHAASQHTITSALPLRVALLDWYAAVHQRRGMPWRKPYDPSLKRKERAQRAYEVWISEIMLQQTQVATVIPYYNRWMARFPTIQDLASSEIETVNALWKGLGYYSRAARLLAGAQKVVKELGGLLPDNSKDLEALIPGIGRYSAGAIASIAYGECSPVLDGNVNRLLSRVLVLHASPKAKPTLDILWEGATAMVDGAEQPGDINQALIELGSTVCKVQNPDCSQCPLRQWCHAYRNSQCDTPLDAGYVPDVEELCMICEPLPSSSSNRVPVTVYPMKAERKKAREELDIVNVIEWRSPSEERWFLLVQRPEGGLLAGLYEFPTKANVSTIAAADMKSIPQRLLSELLVRPPLPLSERQNPTVSANATKIETVTPAGDVVHVFSHIRKTYRVQWVLLRTTGHSDRPPALNPDSCLYGDGSQEKKSSARKKAKMSQARQDGECGVEGGISETAFSGAQWISIDHVADTNIGTGVLKVWNQVKALWTDIS